VRRPSRAQWFVLWGGAIWTLLVLAVAEEYVFRGVFAGLWVTGLLYWQLLPRPADGVGSGSITPPEESGQERESDVAGTTLPEKEPVIAAPVAMAPVGVGGWLILPVLGLAFLGPLVTVGTAYMIAEGATVYAEAIVGGLLAGAFGGWGLFVGLGLMGRWPTAPRLASIFFASSALILTLMFFLEVAETPPAEEPLGSSLGQVIGSVIWFAYFRSSKRVRATYGGPDGGVVGKPIAIVAACGLVLVTTVIGAIAFRAQGRVSAFQIQEGDCFNDRAGSIIGEVASVDTVSCAEPHDKEVYVVERLPNAAFPGDGTSEIARELCVERFGGFVGLSYEASSLDIYFFHPTRESWAQDDREVVCAVYDMNRTKLVGTVRGSRR